MTRNDLRASEPTRSPLTDAQLADLTAVESQLRLVVGTKASGLDRVATVLQRSSEHRSVFVQRSVSDPGIGSYLRRLGDGRHRTVAITVDGAGIDQCLEVLARAQSAVDPTQNRNPQSGTLSITFVADVLASGDFVRFVAGTELRDVVPIIPTQRWTAEAIANFGRDAGLPFDSADTALRVHDATGGWDSLIHDVARLCAQGASLNAVLKRTDLADLSGQLDLSADHSLATAYAAAARFLENSPESALDVAEFIVLDQADGGVGDLSVASALVSQLILAGLLTEDGADSVRLEPVAANSLGVLRS